MFTFIISVLGVNTLTQLYKKARDKYGPTRIHIAAGVCSVTAALIIKMFGETPIFHTVIGYASAVFVSAIALHQVLWKKLADVGIDDSDLES